MSLGPLVVLSPSDLVPDRPLQMNRDKTPPPQVALDRQAEEKLCPLALGISWGTRGINVCGLVSSRWGQQLILVA